MRNYSILIALLITFSIPSFGQQHTVYLIGDAGEPFENGNPVMNLVSEHLAKQNQGSTVLYLGDNIYPRGLPHVGHRDRKEAEDILLGQLEPLRGYKGNVFMIPGNHDWDKGKPKGYQYILHQEQFVEQQLARILGDSVNGFLPDNGCPGPVEISLSDELTLIVLDTQWLLHPWDKPRAEEGCGITRTVEVFGLLEEMLKQNAHKKVIIASHHPMYSYGIHGGVSNFKTHIFPLTEVSESLYIPLPGLGSIYPLYRKLLGNIQDIQHPKYKSIRNALEDLYRTHPNLIHVSGHEHSLQHIGKDSVHYIVSGSGSKSTYVKAKKYARYVYEGIGFGKVVFSAQGKVTLEFWSPDSPDQPIYSQLLFTEKYTPLPDPSTLNLDFSDSTVLVNASDQYDTNKPGLLANYRDTWKTKIEVPVFDIGKVHGGLEIIQRGGGQQTRSLRLEADNGKQYVLRSIEKYAEKAVPEALRGTLGAELVQDQISASHPYAAFVVPYLADAAGVYHTNPQVVYLPDDPRFGIHRADFAGSLALFEERAAGNRKDLASFGNAKKIISTPNMLKELYKDNDNQVDQLWVLKSRLFDMVLADWDRHDDQWRWARFKKDKGHYYRPIPRDRDQAFFVNQGFIMNQVKRKWAMPKFQGFDYKFSYVPGFNFNARYFDRDFLNEPSLDQWLSTADSIQNRLTDDVITSAIKKWPQPVYDLNGTEVIAKLKSQRDNLKDYAREQYLFLAKEVTVHGSNKKEYFHVERLSDEETRVRMYKRTKDAEKELLLYDRVFKTSETKEIRLFGFEGEDVFEIVGDVKKGPKIRVIGGDDEDLIKDSSRVGGPSKKTWVYDNLGQNQIESGKETKDMRSEHPEVNTYERRAFKYDKLIPLILASINRDDGIFIGGGVLFQNHGFRKEPFKSRHLITATGALATGAFNIKYNGIFTDAVGPWDLEIKSDLSAPNSVTNFFGYGNQTEFDQQADENFNLERAIDFYRIRFKYFNHTTYLRKQIGNHASIGFGHHLQAANVETDYDGEDRFFLDTNNFEASEEFFSWKAFQGALVELEVDQSDNARLPTRGIKWNTQLGGYMGLNSRSEDFASVNSTIAFYFSVRLPARLTFATRFGAGHNFGDTEFYQSQVLGGLSNLRGYRKTRFFGDSRFFNNTELRLKLATVRSRLFPLSFGVNAFHDVGRVWVDGDDSDNWHNGYGGGIWIAPLNSAVLSLELSESEEELLFNFRLGFLF